MDSSKFDLITRTISEIASRRTVVRRIVGGGAVTALAGFGALEGAEGKKKKKKKKDDKKKCKVNKCPQPTNPCEEAVCKKDKCSLQDLPDGATCGDGLICDGGDCVCTPGEKFCDGACIPEEDPCFVAVTASDLQGWLLEGEDPFSQNPALTQIVDGPEDPPAPGEGSVRLNPTAFGAFNEADTQAVLRTLQYEGTAVGDIDRLQYSVYVPSTAGDPPTMQLAVVGVSNPDNFASLVFIPGANGNTTPADDDWTTYTPTETGSWVSTRDVFGVGGECLMCRFNGGHSGECNTPANCTPVLTRTWDQIQTIMPDAELNGSGSFSFRIGRGDTGEGNVTNIVFNDDGYFFED
jgi:hypothetical protein